MVGAALGWQYRNAAYLLPLVPALALLAAAWGPFRTRAICALDGGGAGRRLPDQSQRARTSLGPGLTAPAPCSLPRRFCPTTAARRAATNSSCWMWPTIYTPRCCPSRACVTPSMAPVAAPPGPYAMPFAEMGITVTVDQFNDLPQHVPAFRARLREWSLDSADADRHPDHGALGRRSGGAGACPPGERFPDSRRLSRRSASSPRMRWSAPRRTICCCSRALRRRACPGPRGAAGCNEPSGDLRPIRAARGADHRRRSASARGVSFSRNTTSL